MKEELKNTEGKMKDKCKGNMTAVDAYEKE
jgi:hypothetical protein